MNLIQISIRRPVFAWIIMAALIIFGAICLNRMGVSQLPDVDFPIVSVSVNFEGAAPEVIESEIIDPIEQSLSSLWRGKSFYHNLFNRLIGAVFSCCQYSSFPKAVFDLLKIGCLRGA